MEYTERLDIRWDNFEANTRVALKRLRGEREFCDVTLACDGKQVSAHKVILAGGSSFFQQILRQNPHPHPLVYLKGVRHEDLLKILDFVYTGEATIVQEELISFLEVAEDLKIKGLMKKDSTSKTSNKKAQTVPQPEISILERKPSSRINNRASQSPYQENQDDTPLGNIKNDLTDTVHSDVSFGMDNGEEMMEFKNEVLITEKKEMTTNRYDQSDELTMKTIESQNSNGLGFSSAVTSPTHISTHRHQSDSKFSDPLKNNNHIKSYDKDDHHQNQMPVDLNIKIEKDDVSNFEFEGDSHIERDVFIRDFNNSYNMAETELAGSVSNDDVMGHYWYEEGGEYTGEPELTDAVSKDEVAKVNDDEVISMNKKGKHVCSVCGKSCRYDSELKQHMRNHTREKPFLCLYCPKKFTLSCHLKEHTRIHTGEKPYQCLICYKRFTQHNHLKTHKKMCTMKL